LECGSEAAAFQPEFQGGSFAAALFRDQQPDKNPPFRFQQIRSLANSAKR